MTKHRKLKAPAFCQSQTVAIHDRQATELPMGANCVPALVEDPFDRQNQSVVTVSLRDDPLGWMFHHKQLGLPDHPGSDIAQYRAGRKFQMLYEASEIGGIKGMDTCKEPVDGGGITPDVVTEHSRRCRKRLMEIAQVLELGAYNLLVDVLGRGMYLLQAVAARGIRSDWGIKHLGIRFREYLELLAREFGYA
jgi:hypothetical protein